MPAISKNEALTQDLHRALVDQSEDVDQLYYDVRYHVRGTSRLTDQLRSRELGEKLATSNTRLRAGDIEELVQDILQQVGHYSNYELKT